MALAWAHMRARRWSVPTRAALYGFAVVFAAGSLVVYYGNDGPVFVVVPQVSWMLMIAVVAVAALISRRRSRGTAGD